VAGVLAVLDIEREPPAHDRLERRRALPEDVVQPFSDLPIRLGGIGDLRQDGFVTLLLEHGLDPPCRLFSGLCRPTPRTGSFGACRSPYRLAQSETSRFLLT